MEICKDLATVHKHFHDAGVKTISMTIPEAGEPFEPLDNTADSVNDWMRGSLRNVAGVAGGFEFIKSFRICPNQKKFGGLRRGVTICT